MMCGIIFEMPINFLNNYGLHNHQPAQQLYRLYQARYTSSINNIL